MYGLCIILPVLQPIAKKKKKNILTKENANVKSFYMFYCVKKMIALIISH